ncbi:MAG: hypothetical protein QGI09_08245 [Dehalococcoidia bacterium]|nr:hypothetical protein [Dehalococcoidia bacterium]
MASLKERGELRRQEDNRLYEKHGKPLEQEHTGELVAIGPEGHVILGRGKSPGELLTEAAEVFGKGNFAFRRVGHPAVWKWLSLGR